MTSSISFLYGKHAVLKALNNPSRQVVKLFITEKNIQKWENQWGDLSKIPHQVMSIPELDRLLNKGKIHQGYILQVKQFKPTSLEDFLEHVSDPAVVVILDQVTDPHNVGAILRSCAVFGASALLLTERNSASCDGIIAKTASGAMEHVPLLHVNNLSAALNQLQDNSFWVYGLDESGKDMLNKTKFSGRVALVFGAEGNGLRRLTKETCDVLLRLPVHSSFCTLNVSTTVAVGLYEVAQQLKIIL